MIIKLGDMLAFPKDEFLLFIEISHSQDDMTLPNTLYHDSIMMKVIVGVLYDKFR